MTQQIFQRAIAINARMIRAKEAEIQAFILEAGAWKESGETAYYVAALKDVRTARSKLAKLVALQVHTKVELEAVYRNARITKKFQIVFGRLPFSSNVTSIEQEAMLDTLIAEREAAAVEAATVYE